MKQWNHCEVNNIYLQQTSVSARDTNAGQKQQERKRGRGKLKN